MRSLLPVALAALLLACGSDERPAPASPVEGASLTARADGPGSLRITSARGVEACERECVIALAVGETVTVEAVADEGATFTGWGGACSGVGPCRITLSDVAVAVSAHFVRLGAEPSWRVTELSHPEGQLIAHDLDDRGDVVGVLVGGGSPSPRPFLYDGPTGATALLELDLRPVALNDAGVIAFVANDGSRAYRYEGGSLSEIGGGAQPVDVGPQGWIVGFLMTAEGRNRGFADDGTALRVLGALAPDDQSFAWAVNGDGIVVGTSDQRAVRFADGGAVDLGLPPVAAARDVSETGLVVGSAGRTGKWPAYGFVKDLTTGAVTLVDPPPGCEGVSFERVNAPGTIVAQVHGCPKEEGPMVWSGRYQRIAELVPDLGWTVTGAPEINDRGQILVVGHGADSLRRAAILTPPGEPR